MCVCLLVSRWRCVCESVWLLSSHVCHLLPLQVAPPRADVVDASSHPAPSPVPRYYHTTHWLMNLLDTRSLVSPCVCVWVGMCKCPSIWVCAVGSVFEGLIYHYLVIIYCSYQPQVMTSKCHKCCFIGSVLLSIVCLRLHQTEQLEVLLANVPFYFQNYVKANPPQGAIIYNGWLPCHYHLALRAQVPHLTWRSMVDYVCVLSVKTVAFLVWLCPAEWLVAYLTTWPSGGC